jgi:hypothetical protein
MNDILRHNLLSPIALAFGLGVISKLVKSEFSIPKELYQSLAIYLLFAIGLKGGVELSHTTLHAFLWPALVTLALGVITPLSTYGALRKIGKFSTSDAAGIAAHYGSVSAVTFIAAQQFVSAMGVPAEGFMPTLLTLLESPGIHIALAIGAIQKTRHRTSATPNVRAMEGASLSGASKVITEPLTDEPEADWKDTLRHVLTARTMILLVGGLLVGFLMGDHGWEPIKPFFETGFKGALTLFLLEMGLVAGERVKDLAKVGPFLLGFGMIMPVIHGFLGVCLGHWAGLSVGGCTVLGAMAASASYIAAPPAVRMTLPEANPTYSLTLALGITFPFNILIGIPLYYQAAKYLSA